VKGATEAMKFFFFLLLFLVCLTVCESGRVSFMRGFLVIITYLLASALKRLHTLSLSPSSRRTRKTAVEAEGAGQSLISGRDPGKGQLRPYVAPGTVSWWVGCIAAEGMQDNDRQTPWSTYE
jgi:hypothetical protein